jgi:hypothetical protein
MGNATPPKEPPPKPAPEIRALPKGSPHAVSPGETWATLAQSLGIDPWDLIDFNFPGTKQVKQVDFQRATRQVNWYLSEYVGCWMSTDGGKNFAFSNNLTNRGRGDFRGGVIFFPPSAAPGCAVIQIPSVELPPSVQVVLAQARVQLPDAARCLDPAEVRTAQTIYGSSLDYSDIYISNAIGVDGRPFTVALPLGTGWIIVLNLGPRAFRSPNSDKVTMIHELAHAWQSQHHSIPWRFMINCLESQLAAASATTLAAANSNRWVRLAGSLGGGSVPDLQLGPADAYSYVPGHPFGDYGGEQIAQQVEDFFNPPGPPWSRLLNGVERGQIAVIANQMKSVPARTRFPENERSLSTVKYVHKSFPGVVWHG